MQKDIKCDECGALFGKEREEEGILDIKYRDLYRSYLPGSGGIVWGPCRSCGTTVEWVPSKKDN